MQKQDKIQMIDSGTSKPYRPPRLMAAVAVVVTCLIAALILLCRTSQFNAIFVFVAENWRPLN